MDLIQIGKLIRIERTHRGWTQEELAQHAGVDKTTINRLELGGNVRTETVWRVAANLGLEFELRRERRSGGTLGDTAASPSEIPVVLEGDDPYEWKRKGLNPALGSMPRPLDVVDPDAYAVHVSGAHLLPLVLSDSDVICSPAAVGEWGNIAYVAVKRAGTFLLRLVTRQAEGVILSSTFPGDIHSPVFLPWSEILWIHHAMYVRLMSGEVELPRGRTSPYDHEIRILENRINARAAKSRDGSLFRDGEGIAKNETTGEERQVTCYFVRRKSLESAEFDYLRPTHGYLLAKDGRDWSEEHSSGARLTLNLNDGRRFILDAPIEESGAFQVQGIISDE